MWHKAFLVVLMCRAILPAGLAGADTRHAPALAVRASHRGFEVRTGHFVVFATTSADDAVWAAGQAETAWRDAARLADRFGDTHRRHGFAPQAIPVLVTRGAKTPRSDRAAGSEPQRRVDTLFVDLDRGLPLQQQSTALKKAAVLGFFRQTGYEGTLPGWISEGLADHVAALPDGESDFAPPVGIAGQNPPPGFSRSAWVSFLLTANDAQSAPAFLGALGVLVRRGEAERRRRAAHPRVLAATAAAVAEELPAEIARLMADAGLSAQLPHWQENPLAGRPLVAAPSGNDGVQTRVEHEMALLLKLAWRFGLVKPVVVKPGTVKTDKAKLPKTAGGADPAPEPRAPKFDSLAELLTDGKEQWATVDIDGRLLFSRDTDRVESLLARRDNRHDFVAAGGRVVLRRRVDPLWVQDAWLEDNPEDPQRPLVRFRRRSGESE